MPKTYDILHQGPATIPLSASTGPSYFDVWTQIPDSVFSDFASPGFGGPIDANLAVLVFLSDMDASVNTVGVLFSELVGWAEIGGPGNVITFEDIRKVLPAAWNNNASFRRLGTAFEPTPLPVGGVDYPIWTQAVSDPLQLSALPRDARWGIDNLWFHAGIQVNWSVNNVNACMVNVIAQKP